METFNTFVKYAKVGDGYNRNITITNQSTVTKILTGYPNTAKAILKILEMYL